MLILILFTLQMSAKFELKGDPSKDQQYSEPMIDNIKLQKDQVCMIVSLFLEVMPFLSKETRLKNITDNQLIIVQ